MSDDPADSYDLATRDLADLGLALTRLFQRELGAAGIGVHSVTYRVKARDSARDKLEGNSDRFSDYPDLHDLLGVRVVTYFAEEVDAAAAVLTPLLLVDVDQSVDKRALLDADRFGYLSLHYVAALDVEASGTPGWQRFGGRQFEVQIRSILQHAWAEIEHDLGYKAEDAPSREVRRRFSRLAGLLELADDEFGRLRHELVEHERQVEQGVQSAAEVIEVSQSSVRALIGTGAVDRLNGRVAELMGAQVLPLAGPAESAQVARGLRLLGVEDIGAVRWLVDHWEDQVVAFARVWLRDNPRSLRRQRTHRTIGLVFLLWALAGSSDPEVAEQWVRQRRRGRGASTAVATLRTQWAEVVAEIGEPPTPA